MQSLGNLSVYNRSYTVSLEIHELSLGFPRHEQYKGLASQLRDSSKSIVANIVEGYAFRKQRPKRYINHIEVSIGSCDETRLWLRYGFDLGYLEREVYNRLIAEYEEIGKMLWGLLQSVGKQLSERE